MSGHPEPRASDTVEGRGDPGEYTGTYTSPSGFKIRAAQANKNFYFTTDGGVKKLDSVNGNVMTSGVSKGLDLNLALTTGLMLAFNTAVAYRIVWSTTDANNNLLLGAPSQRVEIYNTNTTNVVVNGTFDTDTVWTKGTGWTIASGGCGSWWVRSRATGLERIEVP